jgi:hypothetical protein
MIMVLHKRVESSLLHDAIYLQEALLGSLHAYSEKYGIRYKVIREQSGWRICLMERGTFPGEPETLVHELMNAILVQSLQSRLEQMTS